MTSKEFEKAFDDFIEAHNLYGRSFTYGLALYEMIKGNYLITDDINNQIDDMLIDHVASTLDIDQSKVSEHFSLGAMNEFADISVLDYIARELAGLGEED